MSGRRFQHMPKSCAHRAICLCLAVSLAACSTQTESLHQPILGPTAVPPPSVATPETSERGSKTVTASYQGSSTTGQATASGEPYNPNDLTAASRNCRSARL
jgi:hypothetical protein